jgi:hypothetical protein
MAERAVGEEDLDVLGSGGGEAVPGAGDDVLVNIDRGDVAFVAYQVCEESRVLSRTGTEFEDALTGCRLELFEHHRDDRRLGRGADRDAGAVLLGVDGIVGVSLLKRNAGNERVPGNGAEGGLDSLAAHRPLVAQLVDEGVPQPGRGFLAEVGRSAGLGIHLGDTRVAAVRAWR